VGLLFRLNVGLQTCLALRRGLALSILALGLALAASPTAHAATLTVGKGGGHDFDTIQAAIDAATTGDTVVVYPGTYTEAVRFKGKSIVLRSTNPTDTATVAATIIERDTDDPVVTFAGTESASCVLTGFTIRNGSIGVLGTEVVGSLRSASRIENNTIMKTNTALSSCSGTIQNNTVTSNVYGLSWCEGVIQNNAITSNTSAGMYHCSGTIQSNTITANSGAGLAYCSGIIQNNTITANFGCGLSQCVGTIRNNFILRNWEWGLLQGGGLSGCEGLIEYNTVANNFGSAGGGLGSCSGIIWNNTITGNTADDFGGGLSFCQGTIRDNVITSNSASIAGGGLWSCIGTIEGNQIMNNSADHGGGLCLCQGSLFNNVIAGNRAQSGGGVKDHVGPIVNNTVVANSVSYPSAGGLFDCSGTIVNCIVWGNTAPTGPAQMDQCSTPTYSCIQGWTGGGVGNISADPLFTTGPLGAYYLSQKIAGQSLDSPCVDRGSSSALALRLHGLTTRTDYGPDVGVVDMGYHYFLQDLPPFIDVSPTRFDFTIYVGQTVATQTIQLTNLGGQTAIYSISTSPSAIVGVSPTSGTLQPGEQRIHQVWFDTATLAPAYYSGGLLISWNAPDGAVFVPATVYVLRMADLFFRQVDIAPITPVQLRPYDPITVSALVENGDQPWAPPFWIEVWGSRTGGLTLDRFLTDSKRTGLPGGKLYRWNTPLPLYSIPDGPYTVVYAVDRLGEVVESNKRNNRAVVAAKRILVIRPQTNVDLAVEGFGGMTPNPAHDGQQATFSGRVVNRGSEARGPFWIEFWGSWDKPFPGLNFFLCDSIYVENLDVSATVELSYYPRTLYNVTTGTFTIGCFADRDDSINELDETNNYQFVEGQTFNAPAPVTRAANNGTTGPDIRIVTADFSPAAPTQLAPGDSVTFAVDLINSGTADTGPFWLEYWGSRDGGVTLSDFLAISDVVSSLAPGEARHVGFTKSLTGVPDGPYSVVAYADRPNDVTETNKVNNRRVIAGKRLLVIRPPTGADLTIQLSGAQVVGSPPQIAFSGLSVANQGTADSGPFWVEFWLCPGDEDYPWLHRFACDSIHVDNLRSGAVQPYTGQPFLWNSVPAGTYTLIAFVDRLDQVIETDETNNYQLVRKLVVPAP